MVPRRPPAGTQYWLTPEWRASLRHWLKTNGEMRAVDLAAALGVNRATITQLQKTTRTSDLCGRIEQITGGAVQVPSVGADPAVVERVRAVVSELLRIDPEIAEAKVANLEADLKILRRK